MPIIDSVAAQATSVYNDALSRAKEQYSHAKCLVSAQISNEPKAVHEEMFGSVENAYSGFILAATSRLQSALSAASTVAYGTPTPIHQSIIESMSSIAQSRLSEGLSVASAHYREAKSYISAVQTPAPVKQKLLMQMQDQYYAGLGMAHARYSEFLEAASSALMPTPPLPSKASASILGVPTGQFQVALDAASKHYSQAIASASSQLDGVLGSISSVRVAHSDVVPTAGLAGIASSHYTAAVAEASSSYSSLKSMISQKVQAGASAASSVVIGNETPWTESMASAASENWEAIITKASSQIYGAPTPYFVSRSLLSEAKLYGSQATDAVAAQYSAVQSLISELVAGKEPDFTESVYSHLSSAYYTGASQVVSSASSYAGEAYASASSVVSSVFTSPPILEVILDSASSHVSEVVEAASTQFYGTKKGSYEQAVSSASSAYSSMSSVVSEQVYGTSTEFFEAAQRSIADVASSAQKALSEALYGTPTGAYDSVTSAARHAYASATSIASDQYSSAQAAISEVFYGREKGALESAQSRLSVAVESARKRLAEFAVDAGTEVSEAVSAVSEGIDELASSVGSALSPATTRNKDEL
jgi:hypothetical protein